MDDEVLAAIGQDSVGEDSSLLYEDMKRIGDRQLPKVTNILKKLSRKLATKISRRYRMSKKVVKVDLRRSIKSNIRYGGIIFNLKYKQKRVQKPNILLVCDVSGSMARYAAFVIQFIYGLSAVISHIESFIFAEELEHVTPYFKKIRPFEETMVELIGKSRIWGKGTNFGASLATLRTHFPLLLTSHTVIIVVSDTKTLELERAEQELAATRRSVKEVLLLNTLPQDEWKDLRSVNIFQKYAQVYECYTLAHLERVLRRQFLPLSDELDADVCEGAYHRRMVNHLTDCSYERLSLFYDRLMQGIDYAAWVSYIEEIVSRYGGHVGVVADLACGTGNSSFPWADTGLSHLWSRPVGGDAGDRQGQGCCQGARDILSQAGSLQPDSLRARSTWRSVSRTASIIS